MLHPLNPHARTPPVALMTYPGPCHVQDTDTDVSLVNAYSLPPIACESNFNMSTFQCLCKLTHEYVHRLLGEPILK